MCFSYGTLGLSCVRGCLTSVTSVFDMVDGVYYV